MIGIIFAVLFGGAPWIVAGAAASLIFGFLTLTLTSNQVATGLALVIFGIGVSSLVGQPFVGMTTEVLGPIFG